MQKRAIRILHWAAYRDHTFPLFRGYKVLRFVDFVLLENSIFVNKCFNEEAFSLVSNHFRLTASSHSYCTPSVSNGLHCMKKVIFVLRKFAKRTEKIIFFVSFCMFPFHGNIIFSELFFKRKCKEAASFRTRVFLHKYEILVYDSWT